MSIVTARTEIAAPPEAVWEIVMDPGRLGEWVTIHHKLGKTSGKPAREGFEMDQTLQLRGVHLKVRWDLVECQAPRRAVWEGRGPARSRAHTEYLLTAIPDGTRFDYTVEVKPPLGPLGEAASRALVGGLSQREAQRSLGLLKRLVEAR